MGRYTKRKDGRYASTITIGGKKHYIYGKTQKELEDKKLRLQMEHEKNHLIKTSSMIFENYANDWYITKQVNRNPNTRDMYYNTIYKHIIPTIGHIPLNKICKSDIQDMINSRSEKPETCKKIMNTCKQIFNDAIDDDLIYKNPCRKIILPKSPRKENPPFSKKELNAIMNAKLSDMDRAYINCLLAFGARRGEILGLMKSDFDFKKQIVHFQRSISFDKNDFLINPFMKTGFSQRDLYIPVQFVPALKQYVASCDNLYLFTKQNGQPITQSSYTKMWNRIHAAILDELLSDQEKKMGIQPERKITALTFRHDFATRLYYSGISRKKAVEIMGHSGTQMIERVYASLDAEKEKAEEKIDTMFSDIKFS